MRRQTIRMGPGGVTPMVKQLLIANGVVFLLQILVGASTGIQLGLVGAGSEGIVLGPIGYYFALVPELAVSGFLWQLITYQFVHGSFFHILFNMFVLWMFGVELERVWGATGFLRFYLVCGVAAGLSMVIFNYGRMPVVGASGAIYGLLGAFAVFWPNREVYVWGIFPIKIKYWVLIIGGVELMIGITETQSGIAHMAHMGGLGMGLVYVLFSDPRDPLLSPLYNWVRQRKVRKKKMEWEQEQERREDMVQEADRILDKLKDMSWDELSDDEKRRIREISDELDEF